MLDLLIFDLDGTLAKKFTLKLLPGVADFFRLALGLGQGGLGQGDLCAERPRLAIATNQGGVGLRTWMEMENRGFPWGYPTVAKIEKRLHAMAEILAGGDPERAREIDLYSAFAYQDRTGRWSPVPPGRECDPRWQPDWRKPGPGMLLAAIQAAGSTPKRTLFVGDSKEDQAAAQAAGCKFQLACEFFDRPWAGCADLESILRVQ
jgi:histidinol phosphatase-like enzyme